ncbi:hypothetical protein JZ751_022727, partial [Albula glossodonta]
MTQPVKLVFQSIPLLIFIASVTLQVCVELFPETEAVEGKDMKLICIICKRRAEINMRSKLDWYYITHDNKRIPIFQFIDKPEDLEGPWKGRLLWFGSKDLQDLTIILRNATLNDSGTYMCEVTRTMKDMPSISVRKNFTLVVREEALPDTTAFYSMIMMYVLLSLMSLWLVVALIYCFRKIARAEARVRDNAYTERTKRPTGLDGAKKIQDRVENFAPLTSVLGPYKPASEQQVPDCRCLISFAPKPNTSFCHGPHLEHPKRWIFSAIWLLSIQSVEEELTECFSIRG